MKSKGLQPRLLYPVRPSIKMESKIQFPRPKKAERTYLHQTSPARDAKGNALKRGRKRVREREEHIFKGGG